ncbi:hypothetical protein [Sphingomonas sp. C3-2]|uniref:hypothetical protein n=1 Tax=Sphingomonas sp. C3-2 TaxID=3062169 RepID=UPI00294B6916|nr:hypothetical protein [Sphingomonas sp. C3-2]WOK37038.1 hypothetical protein QYC26_02265 [Sphingomonas sp. C3-2]
MRTSYLLLAALVVAVPTAGFARAQESGSKKEEPAPSSAQKPDKDERPSPKKDDTIDKAGDIVTQPARDIGVVRTEVPPLLQAVVENPYSTEGVKTCKQLADAVHELNAVLGEDFGVGRENNENRFGKFAEAGGKAIVNSLIPFRGLVREVTGAGPAERRRDAAIAAGFARRGFLRGMHQNRGCKTALN